MTHLIVYTASGLVLLYVAVLLTMWRYQERIVFQPPRDASTAPIPGARVVRYCAADGVDLFAYLVGDCAADSALILAFHGNADLARWFVPWAIEVARHTDACVMLPEFRGYDGIAAAPTYPGSSLDAQAALRFVRDSLGVSPANTVYYGHSLGTAIAAELTLVEAPRALLLHSPFSSARAMSSRMAMPGITAFWRLISRVHFDTIERVRQLASPVWVTHGDRDLVVPVRMGREVFAAAAHPGELLIVRGAAHNDVPEIGGKAYWDWLVRGVADRSAVATTGPAPTEV